MEKSSLVLKINITGISGEHYISPANESLSPYLEGLSPVSDKLSPEKTEELST